MPQIRRFNARSVKSSSQRRWWPILAVLLFVAIVASLAYVRLSRPESRAAAPSPVAAPAVVTPTPPSPQQAPAAFNKQLHSIDTTGSIWAVVNKKRPLSPQDYVPDDLVVPAIPLRSGSSSSEMQVRKITASALEAMTAAAKSAGINLMLASGYRSYNLQVAVYNNNVKQVGQAEADRVSARPGTSEHQTGLAADIEPASRQCEVDQCFGTLPEGIWVAAHAHEYGFVIRYPNGKEAVTGYTYEPWHLRYVGTELAGEMHKTGVSTLEEFFGLPNGQL